MPKWPEAGRWLFMPPSQIAMRDSARVLDRDDAGQEVAGLADEVAAELEDERRVRKRGRSQQRIEVGGDAGADRGRGRAARRRRGSGMPRPEPKTSVLRPRSKCSQTSRKMATKVR